MLGVEAAARTPATARPGDNLDRKIMIALDGCQTSHSAESEGGTEEHRTQVLN
jgi:hypothetical protein